MTPKATAADVEHAERKRASALVAGALKIDTSPDALARLAARLGASEDTVMRWATGTNYPPITRCEAIVRELSK